MTYCPSCHEYKTVETCPHCGLPVCTACNLLAFDLDGCEVTDGDKHPEMMEVNR